MPLLARGFLGEKSDDHSKKTKTNYQMIKTYIGNDKARARQHGLSTDLYVLKDGRLQGLKAALVKDATWQAAPRAFDPIGCTNALHGEVEEIVGELQIPPTSQELSYSYGRFVYADTREVTPMRDHAILLISGGGHYALPKDTKVEDLLVKPKPKRAPRKASAKKAVTKKAASKKPTKKASKSKA